MTDLAQIGLTKRQITALSKKNIFTAEDLVQYAPRTYYDYRTFQFIKNADPEKHAVFNGTMTYCDKRLGKKWYIVIKMTQDDGTPVTIMMFSETFRFKEFARMIDKRIAICGKPQYDQTYGWSVKYPERLCLESEFHPCIAPVYTKIQGISDEAFQKAMTAAIETQEEPLDKRLVSKMNIITYPDALRAIHAPETDSMLLSARKRIRFNDMMYYAEALKKMDSRGAEKTDILFRKKNLIKEFEHTLPYKLTEDQNKIIELYLKKTGSGLRFNALIQGDVGCGKTIVAISMIVNACENGYQAVLMAPREVLARQHYEEVKQYAEKMNLSCVFLASSTKEKEKKKIIEQIKNGDANIIVGTHSCISDSVEYNNLGLIVTDEEHLFGVKQKEKLENKAEEGVHSASMSATPIPRSLATILYGHKKDIMTIKSMPAGRLPVKTTTQVTHKNVFPFMEQEIKSGHQCYVVCPAIEENEEYGIVSIERMETAYKTYFEPKGISVGIVNGKMDTKEVEANIRLFSEGKLNILMSTTVIEVGVNVPNATVMIVEQAERFGLASLHQLRGRVGRSNMQSYCILISNDRNNARLATMVRTTDGFEIAEADLSQRGSGDLLGVRQAGNNRFVNNMLKNPVLFQQANRVIDYSEQMGYENHLERIYGEHAESVGEDAE